MAAKSLIRISKVEAASLSENTADSCVLEEHHPWPRANRKSAKSRERGALPSLAKKCLGRPRQALKWSKAKIWPTPKESFSDFVRCGAKKSCKKREKQGIKSVQVFAAHLCDPRWCFLGQRKVKAPVKIKKAVAPVGLVQNLPARKAGQSKTPRRESKNQSPKSASFCAPTVQRAEDIADLSKCLFLSHDPVLASVNVLPGLARKR